MKSRILILTLAILSGISATCFADVKPAAIFGSGMVLQREVPVKIWGTADAREKVTVVFNGRATSAKADKTGKWSVTLPGMAANADAATMTITGKTSKVEFDNILVGDVWLCSGQSNMEWTMSRLKTPDSERDIASADYPEIRCFTATRVTSAIPKEDIAGSWAVCSPETAGGFTAVGYYYARELWSELKIPVGIINSSWGGTFIEAWTSQESYAALPGEARRIFPMTKEEAATANRPNNQSSLLFNGMIAPITGYKIKGAIWYQGEANAPDAYVYRTLFPNMINDWRGQWGYEFPFYWVQLANYRAEDKTPVDSDWAELREAQTMTLSLPRTGQAVIIDIGEAGDIHPRNKADVGRRLALQAFHDTYGKEGIVWNGPTFSSMTVGGQGGERGRGFGGVTIEFDTYGSELVAGNKYGYIEGFAIAGADRVFHWAQARLTRDGKVMVWSREVREPVAVRYAWSNNPMSNLFNAEGLPAAPFRTDDWPGMTVIKK